ncbi:MULTISPECIES: hypothetical protein [Chryseobacterium]|uniref:Uncharacterized protein n=1 Tax=Chryseobacterium gambrini TaxID=373672 RepID=A0AAJ1R568_9FLAO|nr:MULTISPECIES: hypothetical protein [Chryseobacterium]MDN4014130.1 hypothetical protein [Chryseobacterium gambrini]MDN4028185.1 hypothetical protein [Chryseobacterium gambrini]QWA39895.1 hypothetical protein KKI44_06715 [Chryseobacterium sp. ZHDP1]
MNETERINEDLRQYKLFKIQRVNTHEQKFKELKNDFVKIQKNEILNYLIAFLNMAVIVLSLYNLFKLFTVSNYFDSNSELVIFNIFSILIFSLFLTYKFWNFNLKLKKYIKTAENAQSYFQNESENLRSNYENYVDHYLNDIKRK